MSRCSTGSVNPNTIDIALVCCTCYFIVSGAYVRYFSWEKTGVLIIFLANDPLIRTLHEATVTCFFTAIPNNLPIAIDQLMRSAMFRDRVAKCTRS